MRWVLLIAALFACTAICWSKGKNSPGSVGKNKNYPDRDEVEECGRIQIQIRRNTGPFRRLINHPSRSVRLRSDSADHFYVSNRLKLIIDRLILLIASDDVIFIISGWRDVVILSERLSLSYEGRSIRFRYGSNNGASRLRALAGLAIEAGCDWVRNDDDENITCSVKPDDCRVPTDLTFMLDTSGSVGRKNHKEALKFISSVISYFNIGPNATQVSFIPFSTYVHSYFFFNSFSDKTKLLGQVLSTGYSGGWTRTWKALYVAQRYVYNTTIGLGARSISSGVPRVAVILTDGRSNGRNAIPYANRLKEEGVIVFSIGIGGKIDDDELKEFASDPDDDHVFFIDSYTDIEDFVNRLSTYTCQEPGVTDPGNETEVELPEDDFRYFQGMCSSYNQSNTTITIEETDVEGSCSVYVSADSNNRNPGPLTNVLTTYSNTSNTIVKHITLPSGINTTLIYISLRGTGSTMNRCTVTIYDSLFNRTEYTFSLPEDVYNDRALGTLQAVYRSGDFEYRYSIIPEGDYNFFNIDSYSGALTVSGTFDREERSEYRASVLVEDPRISCLKGRTTVILVISDVNDNPPMFPMQSYTVNVLETDTIDSMIITVSAVDQDLGTNAIVTYSFDSSQAPSADFAITSDGVVVVAGSLDGFITPSYEYTVVATDGGQTPMTGTATLSITVEQVNFAPTFTVCLSGICELSLAEDTALGGVLNLSATDPDTGGPDAQLTYSGGSSPFEIDVNTGELRLTSSLDRETVSSYTLEYFVSDGGTPSLSGTVRVSVTVTDVNDNGPVFDPDSYSNVLPENTGETAIFEVKTTDIDEGPNAEILYSLEGVDSPYFGVDGNGVVTTLGAFDFEDISSNPLEFLITASNPNGVFLVTATGSLLITDLNDNSPVISGDITESLPEDSPIGTVVFNLTVSDADSGSNGEVTVELVEGNQNGQFVLTYTNTFAIIQLELSLDFETARSHTLKLRATDGGDPVRITSLDLTLSVGDINDNTPVCIAGVSNKLQEDVAVGTQVGQVTASDGDRPNTPNSEISYSITAVNNTQNYLSLFSVDTAGLVTTNGTLDIELSPQYIISVTASDNGNPARTCVSLVTLTLQDVNEFPPVINTTASALNVSVRENTPVGTVIAVVTATDADFTAGQVMYVLNSPDFSIDAVNGEVRVSSPLDFEMTPSYQLTVIAEDGEYEQTAILSVMIINVNDVTPSLDIDSPVQVSEAAPVDSLVACFNIIDSDGDANGNFSLDISGSGAALLTYNITTCCVCIYLAQPLDREGDLGDNIRIVLTINDNGDPNLHSTTEFQLVILDVNDNSPVFLPGPFTAFVPENTAVGTPVRSVIASDQDTGLNSQLIYSINSTQFAIDNTTSEITVNGIIDFESTPLIQLEVTARDLGTPSLNASVIVTVSVTDINDNVPQITNLPHTVLIAENGDLNQMVFEVTSSDLDTDDNSVNRRYSLSVTPNNIPNFSINPVNGRITADANLFNREGVPDYTLTISVSDGSNSDSGLLSVVITDVNDNPPIFIGDLSFSIRECELNCADIFQVETTDNDLAGTNNTRIAAVIVFNTDSFTASLLPTNDISVSCTPGTLDFETSTSESFILQATDGGSPQLSTNTTILVNIIDCNDNSPIISPPVIELSLPENTQVGTVVADFNATDIDTGTSGVVTFHQQEDSVNFFTIDASTGEVTLIRALDFETNTFHYFNIIASDSGSPSFSSQGSLNVTVVNINDNLPVFNPAQYTITLPENTPVGFIYSEIQATDADGDSIVLSVGEEAPFSTIANTFNLTLNTSLDFETQMTYLFNVYASNPGSTESVSAAVTLNVLDVNDNTPIFTNSISTFNISEDTQIGTFVFAATAEDPDSGTNGMFAFYFDPDVDEFNISSSGSVTTAGNFDREFVSSYILTIIVQDMGNPALNSTMDFRVQITDVNDNIPVFGLPSYFDSIPEDAIPGTLLSAVIIATDIDLGVNGEVDLTGNSAEFAVLSNGSVSLVTNLDFEQRTSYTFTVIATDGGSPSLSNTASYTVQVLNVNDNRPVFSPDTFEQTLEECNQLTHSCLCEGVIFTALATDADNDMLNYSSQIISGSAGIFTINPTTGELTASCEVDREVNDLFEIKITASDGVFTAEAMLSIHITDVNDNIPYFTSPDMIMPVREDTPLSTELATVGVIDRDVGLNGDVELSIQLVYPLNIPSVASITQDGRISLSRALDFESVTEYQFLINASDRGVPSLHNTTTFTLQVTDFNDNAPVFDRSNYSISIDENSPLGDILCVSASDADSGANSQLTFFVLNSTQVEDALESAFTFVGCNLTTLISFNFEEIQHFTIFIGAQDAGSPSLSAIIPVFIQIIDLNDNMPIFEGDYPDPLLVSESTSVGTTILTVRAVDIDSGANGEVTFSLQGAGSNFDITADGSLRTLVVLDFESIEAYSFFVIATDSGTTPLSSSLTITVQVVNENDNTPVFNQSAYSFYISEDSNISTFVGVTSATDADSGVFGSLSYSIALGPSDILNYLVNTSSDISTVDTLDREIVSTYTLTVRVQDGGSPPLFDTATLTITVLDVNDNAPIFGNNTLEVSINENVPLGTLVTNLLATDADEPNTQNSLISFSTNDTRFRLETDSTNGAVMLLTNSSIDRETQNIYIILVTATDNGDTPLSSSAYVTIVVLDLDDNAPVFTDALANITLPEDTPTGTIVATFNVTDLDSSLISYSIQPNDTFSVASSGSVSLISGLDFESTSFYNLTVTASDGTNNPVFATLLVFVTDVNEFSPAFPQNYTASVPENQPQGTMVITVTASDSDSGQQLLYAISGPRANEFQINPNTGVVTTLVSLDREDSRGYVISLQLQVTDSGNPTLVGFATLTLSVSDENDNSPLFVDIPSALTLPENTPLLTNITKIFATDADDGVNAEISYSIQDSGPFDITQPGEIQLASSLDFESESYYRLVVIATDGGANPRSTNATIEITVTDVNDNTPTFLNAPNKTSVAEHSALSTIVFTAMATDLDSGINSQLVFSLTTNPYLSINQTTGVVVVSGVIDRELVDTINVTITVCDRGVPSLCASELLCVTVADINDQNPMFEAQQSTLTLSEGPARTDPVFEAVATDNDDPATDNSRIVSYTISPTSSNFTINNQGQVFAPELDFETTERYQLEITATDGGNPPRSGSRSLIVEVTDVNDNPPILIINPDQIVVPEDLGQSILNVTITASDGDSGANGEVTFLLQEIDTPFSLSSSGVLSLSGMLDFDMGPQLYTLTVVASDNGVPSMNSSGPLIVRVGEVNDNSPAFNQSSYETSIREGLMPVFPVLGVSASDADFNSQISYSLSDDSTFSVDSTGRINGIAEIDFEGTPKFEFYVIATDSGSPQRSVQALVTINIIDINDNAPQIVGGDREINLSESSDHPQLLLALSALDLDSGQNGEVFFTLDSSSTVFSLDGNTGELFLNMSLDFENVQSYMFYITAHDRGDPELNSTITVAVNVINENDNAPIFSQEVYQASVREDQLPVSLVTATVVAQDLDLGVLGELDYTLSDNAFFSNDENGSIFLTNSVNAESVTSLELSATACDRGTPSRCDTVSVFVSILDVNDNSPVITFPTNGNTISISESAAILTTVTNVVATDSDVTSPNNLVSFAITAASNDGLDIFAIDNITGEIYLANSLDFENPSMRLFDLTVTVSDQGFPSLNTTVSFQIQVTDANDNSPVFPDGPLTVSVDENLSAQVGPQFNATDADTGVNARIIFSISESDLVSINQDTGLVTLNGPFDFEYINTYNFTVTATDQGSPSNSATTSLTVHILDANDNTPSFSMSLYTETIPESTAVNQSILTVSAVDSDGTTDNNVVSYSISPSDQTNFIINSNGGISLTQMLDFETLSSQTIQFSVIATDNGDPALSSTAIVRITVTDSNDNSPQIQPIPDAYILEGSANQTVLTTVPASDADSGLNAVLNYSIINSDPVPFSIGNTGSIFVAGAIDRETQDSYTLTVLIQDNGSPSLSTQVTVNVSVLDRNDNPPVFLSLPYTFHVPENVTIDSTVGSIEVTDRDIGINANLTCSLTGIGSDKFHLLPIRAIVAIALLDRETVASYQLTVTCQDTSASPLISTVSLSIIVTDINDNSPQFPSQQYVFDIREDANVNTDVGQLQASDSDDPDTPNAQIEFSILTGNGGSYFSITPDGLLRTNNTNGRIPVNYFTLRVAATDGGIPPLSNSTDVLIRVIDVNDVAPFFNTSDVQPIRISEYTPVGENIANFTATDLEGSEITYSLTTQSGTPGDFRVDPMTGGVFVNRSLDFERVTVYTIEITAVDSPEMGAGPPRTGIVTIAILIIDENDNSPVFFPEMYQVNISENLLGPLTLVSVSATDRDSEANGMISYSLSLPTALADIFSINSSTGVVSLASGVSFDFEDSLDNQFDITVIATDGGTPSRQSMALLTIRILDVNDNSPQMPTAYTAVISEGAEVQTMLIRVQATDQDTGLNGQIVYSLAPGESVPFEIIPDTGDIFSTLALDRETISSYSFIVIASDRGNPSRENSTNVTVIVQDVNDNCPVIANGDIGQSILEGTSGEVLSNNFQVSDLDSGLNGEFNYSIADPALQQIFRINSATGQLSLLQSLDRETVPQYNLTVLITDGGVPACTATTFIIIDVLDLNDNPPIFIDTPYVANISEGVPLNTSVICVSATDADVGVNAQFTLELAGTNPFTLDSTTGCISTDGELDREMNPQFSLTVMAIQIPFLPTTANVLVNLLDRNDVTPHFTMDPYTFTITNLEVPTEAVIGVLTALDEDEGLNGQLTYAHVLSETTLVEQTYAFSVSDMGTPSLSSGTDVIINFPSCEHLEIFTTNTNNEVNIFIRTFCSASVELVSTFTVINSSVTFDCIVVTNLPFTVEWFREGDPLQGASSQTMLTIESLTEAEEGDYTCEASTSEHVLTSEPYTLVVQIPPIITIPPRNLAINDGDTLNLTCYSIGVPDPEHQWTLISDSLENGFVVLPSEDAPEFDVTKNQLTLLDINVEYEGSYSCNASNVVGYDVASGEVIIHVPADLVSIGLPTNFSNPDPNNNGCNNLLTPQLEDILSSLTGTLSSVTSATGDSNLCDPSGGTTTPTTTTPSTLCDPNPCNGYTCTDDPTSLSGFFCECPPTLEGTNCNVDVNECSQTVFCQNGATCINTFDGFTCNCASGYTGVTCEAQITCTETSCPDGQMCMDTVDGFDCLVTQNVTVNTTNEQSAENVANTAGNEGMNTVNRRRRRQTGTSEPAYRNCTIIPFRESGSTVVTLIIGCLEGFTLQESDFSEVCQNLYDSFANFRTCSTPTGSVITGPKTPPTPGVIISVILRDPTSREVIPGSTAVVLINDRLNEANDTLVRQLGDIGFSELDVTQISVSSPPVPAIPGDYTAAIVISLLILLIVVVIVFFSVLLCVCLRRRSKEDKVTSYEQSALQQPVSYPVSKQADLEQALSVEMHDVSTEQPENAYGIVEQAVAVNTTFSNPNAVESEEPVPVPAKQSLASKFSFKKDNAIKEEKVSLVPEGTTETTEAPNLASSSTDTSKKPPLGKTDSLPKRFLAATTSFGKKKEHSGIDATPLIDENTGSNESLPDHVPEPLPEKLPPKKKSFEPQSPTINERELVAGALVPVTERDREYREDEQDVYYNVEVKADATMAQLWETAIKDEKQEKKLIAGKKLITVQSQEDIQSGASNTEQTTAPTDKLTEPTDKPTEPTDTPTEPTDKPTEPTDKPTEPTDKPTEPTEPTDHGVTEAQSIPQKTSPSKKPLAEKVEQTLSYPWYHSNLDREGAEIKLMQMAKEGAFLVRAASSSKGDYSLSILVSYKEPLIKHLLIKDNGSQLVLQSVGARDTFPHLAALVAYYSKEVFEFPDWQKTVNLLYPVFNQ